MDFPQETYHTGTYWGNQHPPASAFAVMRVGVSENSVPLNPMVNDHYPY